MSPEAKAGEPAWLRAEVSGESRAGGPDSGESWEHRARWGAWAVEEESGQHDPRASGLEDLEGELGPQLHFSH